MTRQSFWAQTISKKSTLGSSYGGFKKIVTKLAKMPWRVPSSNSCHRHKLGWNSKKVLCHFVVFGLRFYTLFTILADGKGLILGFEIFGFVYLLCLRKTHVTSLVEYSTLLELYGKVCEGPSLTLSACKWAKVRIHRCRHSLVRHSNLLICSQ